jgi:hypothetical protein
MVERGEDGLERVHDWLQYNPDPRPSDTTDAWRVRKQRERERKRVESESHAGYQDHVTRDTPVTSRESHATKVVEEEVEEESSTTSQTLKEAEARPPAARDFSAAQQVDRLFTHWAVNCRTRSQVALTKRREINVRSRASHDGFTFEELTEAIDGAAKANNEQVLPSSTTKPSSPESS